MSLIVSEPAKNDGRLNRIWRRLRAGDYFRSLRWRLLMWQAAILLVVVAGFGIALYLQTSRARLDEADGELATAARALDGALRNFTQGGFPGGPPEGPPPRDQRPGPPPPRENEADGFGRRGPPPPEDAEGQPRRPFPPGENFNPPRSQRDIANVPQDHLERILRLPRELEDRYRDRGTPLYIKVSTDKGRVLVDTSPPGLEKIPSAPAPSLRRDRGQLLIRGALHEYHLSGPQQTTILVGRSMEEEYAALRQLAWRLTLTGLGVFAVGITGGWWLSRPAVQPIEAMSNTAASITASNFSRRIELQGVDTELGELGAILNSMLDRLQAAFEQQVRFTADASHELRTPLAVILSHVELALARPRSPEQYRDSLDTCLRAGQRMKFLVDDLLTLARADAGKLELKTQPVNLRRIVEESATLLEPLAVERGVRISVAGTPAQVFGDADRLSQVVNNLLNNAIQYNRPDGQIALKTAHEGNHSVLTVADTGLGIRPEDRPFIFDRFYRVNRARSRDSGGSGLGLAICKSIVEAHGGTIAITSREGAGTTIVVQLPAK